jgi:hypothetical protein
MHSIPQLVASIKAIAFSPRGNAEFIQAVMNGGVPAIIYGLPHLNALPDRSEKETDALREVCEQIIASVWGWPYPDQEGVTSLTLAAQILPTLPPRPVPEAPVMPEVDRTAFDVAAAFEGNAPVAAAIDPPAPVSGD